MALEPIIAPRTGVRWRIFLLLLLLITVNYIDRASLSVALPIISTEFHLEPAAQGLLLSAFFWTYSAMQIPGGLLADWLKPRIVIAGATIVWGLFQCLGAGSTGIVTLVISRLGTMNFCTTIFNVFSTILIGFIVQETGSYYYVMMFFGAMGLLLLICSMSIRYSRSTRQLVLLSASE